MKESDRAKQVKNLAVDIHNEVIQLLDTVFFTDEMDADTTEAIAYRIEKAFLRELYQHFELNAHETVD